MDIRLCVFPTDSLAKYVEKGEVKKRYWNPCDFFGEIHVIGFSNTRVEASAVRTAAGKAKLYVHTLPRPSLFSLWPTIKRVERFLEEIRPDVVRAFSPNWVGFVAVKAAERLGIPSVISVHGNLDETRRGLRGFASSFLETYAASHATAFVCMTRFLKNYAKRHGARNVRVTYNKVYFDDFKKARENKKREGLLWVGRLDFPKLPELVIKAAASLGEKLVIIGDGEKREELKGLVKRLRANVVFLRSVPHAQIWRQYANAKVLVMASASEGFCIPVLEAMAAGTPLVASDIPAIREVSGGAALLVENNEADFARAISKALENKKGAELRRKGIERAKALDGAKMEKQEKSLYASLVKK